MDSDSESSSEPDGYVQDGFVVPDEPLEDHLSDQELVPKKRRIRLKRNDQDDIDLIQENFGIVKENPPEKKPKLKKSDSEESLEPGEIPLAYNESIQLAASIFGTSTVSAVKEERTIDFEPAERHEKFIRSEDDVIRELDIPERLQIVFKNRENPNEKEIGLECQWLLNKLLEKSLVADPIILQKKLTNFLYFYRIEKYEIPFIAKYRIHVLKPELDCDIWELYNWDKEWSYLYSTKESMTNLYKLSESNMIALSKGQNLYNNEKVLTKPCKEVEDELGLYPANYVFHISDLEAFFKVHVYTYTTGRHTAKSYNPLQDSRNNKIDYFTQKAALTPSEFSENLKSGTMINSPIKPAIKPQNLAFELLSSVYTEEIHVISAACELMKSELAALPSIRSYIRDLYLKYARICTSPNEKGRTILDVFHPYYRVKNLVEGKAINTWTPELWAEVLKCEEQELIQVEFKLPWENDKENDRIFHSIKHLYLTQAEDEIENDWNLFRSQVLKQALAQLYEETKDIVRKDLTLSAEDWIRTQVQTNFFKLINTGKLKTDSGKIISFVTDPDSQVFGLSYMVVLNEYGEILEIANFNTLTLRKTEGIHDSDKSRYIKEKNQLAKIILQYQPDAIIIGSNSLQSITLRKNLMQLIEYLQMDTFNEMESELQIDRNNLLRNLTPVYMINPQVPKLFASSQRSKRLFPEYKILTRIAISLGRMVQNACAETLCLHSDPNELQLKYLNLHPLQSLISVPSFLGAIEIVALDYVSQTGVLINEVINRDHLAPLLSFVPGLGPVKAHGLIENIKQKSGGKLLMRAQLVGKRMLGNRVYENAAGFIRIPYEERESDPLDSTRIHPESYELAKVIARSVFSDSHIRDENLIQEVMSRPQKMLELDLEKYAEIHQAKTGLYIKGVLESIVSELTTPYYILDKKIFEVTTDELLYLTTGETKHTLKKGSVVQACVLNFDDRKNVLKCRLECGLEATVDMKFIPEKKNEDQEERFKKGEVITARVIEVNTKSQGKDVFFKIRLSLQPDDIINHGKFIQLNLDDAFVMEDADWIEKAIMEDEYKTGQKYIPRVVNHPKFKNIGLRTACEELFNKDIGESLFRPSSRGQDHLTCTWKFYDFIYSHLDIIEEGKPAINMLGTKFRISNDVYDSLQEILDRYVGPCEKLTKDSISHPKFKDTISGGSKLIENLLIQERRARPSSIPYYFTIRPEYPQYFLLYYLPREEIICEYIKVKPRGLFFHEAYHPNINFLISWFKRHYVDKTYKSQLIRSKPPIIDTSNHLSIPGRVAVEEPKIGTWNDENSKPMTPRNFPDATPYAKTPHIGNQEWAGGKEMTRTPRADDWEMSRNFDSWGDKTPREGAEVPKEQSRDKADNSWGETSNWADVPTVPETNWSEEPKTRGERGERGIRRGGRGCRKCGEEGHMSRECTSEKKDACFKCGQIGHMSRECPNPSERPPRPCYNCGETGHISKECPNPSNKQSNGRECFKCGQTGHMSRECPNPDESRGRRPRGRGRGRRETGNDDSNAFSGGTSDWAGSGDTSGWGDTKTSSAGWGGEATTSSAGWGGEATTSSAGWGGEAVTSSAGWGDANPATNAWGSEPSAGQKTDSWNKESKPAEKSGWEAPSTEKSEWSSKPEEKKDSWGSSEKKEVNDWSSSNNW
jgi:transcription elongation factor SPT6